MAPKTIAELPFLERPLFELLDLEVDRPGINRDYSGFGWARVDSVWLESDDGSAHRVDDALVLALHTADDGEAMADDLELEFDLPDRPVTVLATAFLERWLPKLPQGAAIVLVVCNRHRAALPRPTAARVPVHYPLGDVGAWHVRDPDEVSDRIVLAAADWCTLWA